mgnify:CR=1 FL=1
MKFPYIHHGLDCVYDIFINKADIFTHLPIRQKHGDVMPHIWPPIIFSDQRPHQPAHNLLM